MQVFARQELQYHGYTINIRLRLAFLVSSKYKDDKIFKITMLQL